VRSPARARPLALLLLATLAAACTSQPADGSPEPSPSAATAGTGPGSPIVLRVMEFNVEYGGEGVDFAGVPAAIEAAGADIVAIEEGYANMPRIARSVDWPYYDPRTQVLSRYPLLTPAGNEPYTYVEVAPGRVVAVANVHLPSTSYGPFQARDGATPKQIVATEEHKRVPAVAPALEALEELAGQGVPVFLVGDFNAPSHLDWTQEAVGAREQVRFPVAWPVSLVVEEAGLVDSYREANPDPVADPGLTWPANRPIVAGYNPYRNDAPADRIDFVYAGGPARVTDSLLVGEEGGIGVDVQVSPWPTDHRAVVSTFEVEPAPAPTLVSVDRRLVTAGDEVLVRYHARRGDAASIAVVPAYGDPDSDAVEAIPLDEDAASSGELPVSTRRWRPWPYELVLRSATGAELSRAPVWVQARGGEPQLRTTDRMVAAGEPIGVEWRFSPGNRADWIGVYPRGADPRRASYLLWVYTGGTVEGSAVLDRDTVGAWPLQHGEYSVYLLRDDSYVSLARGDFTVR